MKRIILLLIGLVCLLFIVMSCDEFVEVGPPRTALVKATVFDDDKTATAAVLDIYYQFRTSNFASGSIFSITYVTTLSSDEQLNFAQGDPASVAEFEQLNDNTLLPNNSIVFSIWSDLYSCIYKSNAVLEGLEASSKLTPSVKKQLKGEARCIRAFCHFYLVNLWGDVPLVTGTDYRINSSVGRTPVAEVYAKIIDDLLIAKENLQDGYAATNNERVRFNKGAVHALLARVHLFQQNWQQAEIEASAVISQSIYSLPALNTVFNVNNAEAIFQLWSNQRPSERGIFRFVTSPSFCALRPEFVTAFETGDQRRTTWVNNSTSGQFSTNKYFATASNPPAQYSTVLRLAEQYLIRAEARAHTGNISGAQADINAIRTRTSLGNTSASDEPTLLLAIEQERRSEFFNEWGHRWLDLKRTGRADAILDPLKQDWTPTAALFPIPELEMKNNTALQGAQNPGY